MFVVILSPVGSYFKNGLEPVKIMVETEDVRAVRGGTGEAKCGGNYGAANRAGDKAIEKGFSQVLWLDGVERKYVEEGGGMNIMFKIAGKVVTPMLTGSILDGITRRSCIALVKSWGMPIEERLISVDELFEAAANGTLEEAWCVGTAAVISPIGGLSYEGKEYEINHSQIGEVSQKLYDELTGIQWGKKPDPFGWSRQDLLKRITHAGCGRVRPHPVFCWGIVVPAGIGARIGWLCLRRHHKCPYKQKRRTGSPVRRLCM